MREKEVLLDGKRVKLKHLLQKEEVGQTVESVAATASETPKVLTAKEKKAQTMKEKKAQADKL